MPYLDSDLHVNEAMTDFASAFRQDIEGYLWSKLLPVVVTRHRSDFIRQFDKGALLRRYDLRVGKGGRIQDVSFAVDQNLRFNAVDYSVEATMRATESSNADSIIEYEQELTYTALVNLHTCIEALTIKDTLRNPSVMTNNTDLSANPNEQWDSMNAVMSDPVADVSGSVLRIKSRTGHAPNLCVMHDFTWNIVQRHPSVLARGPINPSGAGIVTKAVFEEICGLEPGSLVTTSMTYNTAVEGATPDFRSFIGPDVIIAYTQAAGPRNYGLGQSFLWPGEKMGNLAERAGIGAGTGGVPFMVLQYPDHNRDPRGANVLRVVGGLDQKVLVTDAGELLLNVVDKTNAALYQNFLNN